MSIAFLSQKHRGSVEVNQSVIQKILDENNQLIQCIVDYQNRGKSSQCTQYQQILHRNLVYLATIADSAQSSQSTPSNQSASSIVSGGLQSQDGLGGTSHMMDSGALSGSLGSQPPPLGPCDPFSQSGGSGQQGSPGGEPMGGQGKGHYAARQPMGVQQGQGVSFPGPPHFSPQGGGPPNLPPSLGGHSPATQPGSATPSGGGGGGGGAKQPQPLLTASYPHLSQPAPQQQQHYPSGGVEEYYGGPQQQQQQQQQHYPPAGTDGHAYPEQGGYSASRPQVPSFSQHQYAPQPSYGAAQPSVVQFGGYGAGGGGGYAGGGVGGGGGGYTMPATAASPASSLQSTGGNYGYGQNQFGGFQ